MGIASATSTQNPATAKPHSILESRRSPSLLAKNDDGTISFVTTNPSVTEFEFVAGDKAGKRTLTIRDGEHEYIFTEQN